MNKKAFVLMETIVVIVVISIALLTIFKSYNKILAKVKSENKYDTSEYIYMTNYIKNYLKDEVCVDEDESDGTTDIFDMGTTLNVNPVDFFTKSNCNFASISNPFLIKKIYILSNVNKSSDANLKKFDAYLIDYIKKLDVGDKDNIVIVEYKRIALDDKGNKYPNDTNPLNETYIASLEWD